LEWKGRTLCVGVSVNSSLRLRRNKVERVSALSLVRVPMAVPCPFSKLHPQQKSWSLIFAAVALFHPVRIYMDWASHDRRLVGTDVGELDRPRRRWWPRFFRAETRRARCTLKRVGPPQFGGLVVFVILSRGLEFATIPVAKTFSWCFTVRVFLHDMTSIRALWTH
jgi:hypothetical protein